MWALQDMASTSVGILIGCFASRRSGESTRARMIANGLGSQRKRPSVSVSLITTMSRLEEIQIQQTDWNHKFGRSLGTLAPSCMLCRRFGNQAKGLLTNCPRTPSLDRISIDSKMKNFSFHHVAKEMLVSVLPHIGIESIAIHSRPSPLKHAIRSVCTFGVIPHYLESHDPAQKAINAAARNLKAELCSYL